MEKQASKIGKKIIQWYKKNKRDLPWRHTTDPYKIWLSEIILQQTRVNQGIKYYLAFIEKFPTIFNFANAPIDEILKLWQGLGYYTRARNMHITANTIVKQYGGHFPDNYNDLLKLKGIGEYTAAAIASFSFGQAHPVVDGNVFRVLSRLYAIKKDISLPATKSFFIKTAHQLMNNNDPGTFNQAIMEFGALQCLPSNPDCTNCTCNTICIAYQKQKVQQFPVKSTGKKLRKRYFHYFILLKKNNIVLTQRKKQDIWHSLYEFPLIETSGNFTLKKLKQTPDWHTIFNSSDITFDTISKEINHILSHQLIIARFYTLKRNQSSKLLNNKNFLLIPLEKIHQYAIPRLIEKYIRTTNLYQFFTHN